MVVERERVLERRGYSDYRVLAQLGFGLARAWLALAWLGSAGLDQSGSSWAELDQ